MKKIICSMLLAFAVIMMFACGKQSNEVKVEEPQVTKDAKANEVEVTNAGKGENVMSANIVEMSVKGYGLITIELDPLNAPLTCENFVNLVSSKFYDGLTFHRIMRGFMIQGGDPEGNGTGGSEKNVKGEFKSNGVDNKISHKRGVISMARAKDPDSGSSQFFICDADDEFLDGDYAAFGHVTEGMDVVDKIAADAKPEDNNGTIPFDQQPVIEYIKMK